MKRYLTVLLLLVAAPAVALDPQLMSKPGETYGDWIDRLVTEGNSMADRVATQSTEEVADRVSDKAVPEGSPETQGSLRDFLPLFFSSLGLGNAKDENGALTLTFNPEFLGLGPDNPFSLQAIVRDPVVFDALVKAIPENIRADRKSALEDDLEDFDNLEFSLSWSRESERFGRDLEDHKKLMGDLFAELTKAAASSTGTVATKKLLNLLAEPGLPTDLSTKTPGEVDPSIRGRLDPVLIEAAQEIVARHQALVDHMRSHRWFELDDLVNNQPQILASAVYRRRNELIGPDEWTASFSFEMGFANINGLKRHCQQQGEDVPDSACLSSFLTKVGSTTDIAPRVKIEGEYSESDPYLFELPVDNFSYSLDRVRKAMGKASIGGYMLSNAQGNQTTRVDLEALFEDVTGDAKRNNRFVATLTFTQKLTGDMSAALSAVYANKPEYRGEVDEELSARLGLRYKIDKRE